ncbi:MAG: hypothetical protein ACHQF2_10300, partial [Flavobacteriales bacterium]
MKTKLLITIMLYGFYGSRNSTNAQVWSAVGGGLPSAVVYSMAVYNGELYLGGDINPPMHPSPGVIKWNNTSWLATGPGLMARVKALKLFNGEVYAGYDSPWACIPYKWNGSTWTVVG